MRSVGVGSLDPLNLKVRSVEGRQKPLDVPGEIRGVSREASGVDARGERGVAVAMEQERASDPRPLPGDDQTAGKTTLLSGLHSGEGIVACAVTDTPVAEITIERHEGHTRSGRVCCCPPSCRQGVDDLTCRHAHIALRREP